MASRKSAPLPPWSLVASDDPRLRDGAVELSEFVSGQWAHTVKVASNRPWPNAAKVVALLGREYPDARYVEGWATMGGVREPLWHAWVDVPLDRVARSWMRIDATPMWRSLMKNNVYGPVLEVRAADLIELVEPLLQPRGRARCRLPLAEIPPEPHGIGSYRRHRPAESFRIDFGPEAAERSDLVRATLDDLQRSLTSMIHTDGKSELDRLAAMRILPPER